MFLFQGIWAPRKIDNPDFFEDSNPFAMKTIAAVGFELWSMQSDILFDNLIIADDQSIVDQWTAQTLVACIMHQNLKLLKTFNLNPAFIYSFFFNQTVKAFLFLLKKKRISCKIWKIQRPWPFWKYKFSCHIYRILVCKICWPCMIRFVFL